MYVYIIAIIVDGRVEVISKEGYSTLALAQRFVETRSDAPIKRSDFMYYAKDQVYEIIEVKIV